MFASTPVSPWMIRTTSSTLSVSWIRSRSSGEILPEPRQGAAQPVDEAGPVGGAEQNDREAGDLAGLHQGERLEQLVQRPETAGQADERLGVLHEHRLAREEVPEVDPQIHPLVEPLLERQLDAEPDRVAARLAGNRGWPLPSTPGPPPVITA